MDVTIEALHRLLNNTSIEVYVSVGIGIFITLVFTHILSSRQEKKKLQKTIDQNVEVFQKAFDLSDDSMIILGNNYEIVYANKSMIKLLELDEVYQGKYLKKIASVNIKNEWISVEKFIVEQHSKTSDNRLTFPQSKLKTLSNKEISVNLHYHVLLGNKQKEINYHILTIKDLTKIHESENVADTHKLTRLPNQVKALKDLPALFSKLHLDDKKLALVLLSFDRFSRLRAIIGYEQSNEVIIKFAKYLRTITNEMNIGVYHTFDNYFLLTISEVDSVDRVEFLVEEIQKKLATFYKIEQARLHLTVSAGIAVYPDSGSTRKLLDNTYKALAQAQKDGDSNIVVHYPSKMENDFDELRLHNDMQKGLSNGEFEVYYQPIVTAKTEEVVSAEALIRWIHPELGFIPPDVFIGLMEKTGFIIKLGKYVLEEVLKQQKRWELFKFKSIEVSINVSMVEIATGKFVEHVEKQLKHHQVHPDSIKFEITEGVAMMGEQQTEKYFRQLKELGVGISLDDFGTGYTSFTYLKKFPADILKIDKSLVDNILTDEEDKRIVYAIIELGHNLGMKIVIEGVETKDMLSVLVAGGCDYIQGYYFSRPLPVFEFQKLLR